MMEHRITAYKSNQDIHVYVNASLFCIVPYDDSADMQFRLDVILAGLKRAWMLVIGDRDLEVRNEFYDKLPEIE